MLILIRQYLKLSHSSKNKKVIAVSRNNKLAGIFTIGDLNRLIKGKKKFNYNDKIGNFITKKPFFDITDKVEDITKLVKKYNLGQFVVLDQNKVYKYS